MTLAGRAVLLLEDDPLLSADLAMLLEDFGATVVGPYRTLAEGLASVDGALPAAALLDVELLDGKSFAVADRLRAAGVPFLFYSAKGSSGYEAAKTGGAPILSKAHPSREAVDRLVELAGE